MIKVSGGIMHSHSARALHHLDRYCIVLVCTLKHVSPAKHVITITYSPICGQMKVPQDSCISSSAGCG